MPCDIYKALYSKCSLSLPLAQGQGTKMCISLYVKSIRLYPGTKDVKILKTMSIVTEICLILWVISLLGIESYIVATKLLPLILTESRSSELT